MINTDYILEMPDDITKKICMILSIVDLMNLCKIHKKIQNIIWDNNYFWKEKYILEYGNNVKDYKGSWRKLYLEQKTFASGDNEYALLGSNKKHTEQEQIALSSIKAMSYNYGHVGALTNVGDFYVWGMCDIGSGLGLEKLEKIYEPIKIKIGDDVTVKYINCGIDYTYIIDENNSLWGSGNLSYLVPSLHKDQRILPIMDKLSTYDVSNKNIFDNAKEVVSSNSYLVIKTTESSYYLWERKKKNKNPIKLDFDYGIKQCCALDDCILILDDNGKFWTSSIFYGSKPYDIDENFDEIYYMGEIVLTKVFDTTIKSIVADKSQSICLLTPLGHLYVVGNNKLGCFGNNLPKKLLKPVRIENILCNQVSVVANKTVIIDKESNVHIISDSKNELIDNMYANYCISLPTGYIICGYKKIY